MQCRETQTMNPKQLLADETGVSPVIGVVLLVATTAVLSALIGTFVLGLGQDVDQTATAGVSPTGDRTVTLNSVGPNTDGVRCSDADETGDDLDSSNDRYDDGDRPGATETVGDSISCSSNANSVVAFGDGIGDAVVYTFDG